MFYFCTRTFPVNTSSSPRNSAAVTASRLLPWGKVPFGLDFGPVSYGATVQALTRRLISFLPSPSFRSRSAGVMWFAGGYWT